MATEAQQVNLVLHEHALVRGAVGGMADHATFNFGFVLIDEGPLLFGVALVTDRVTGGVGAKLLGAVVAVRIVAVVALQQAFRDAVMEGPCELRADVLMARVTKLWRFRLHQELAFLGVMRRVAVDTGDAVGEMHGAVVVAVLLGVLVAAEAAGASLLRGSVLKSEDLGDIAAAVDMGFARAVAGFASVPLDAFVGIELGIHGGGEVRSLLKARVDFVVAGLAGVGACVEGGVGGGDVGGNLLGILLVGLSVTCDGGQSRTQDERKAQDNEQSELRAIHGASVNS